MKNSNTQNGWPAKFGDGVICHNQKELDDYLIGVNHEHIAHGCKLSTEISFAVGALSRDQLEDVATDIDITFDKWTNSDDLRALVIEAAHKNGGLVIYDDSRESKIFGFGFETPTEFAAKK